MSDEAKSDLDKVLERLGGIETEQRKAHEWREKTSGTLTALETSFKTLLDLSREEPEATPPRGAADPPAAAPPQPVQNAAPVASAPASADPAAPKPPPEHPAKRILKSVLS